MRNFFFYFVVLLLCPSVPTLGDDLVVFSASWCPPCVNLKKMLKEQPKQLENFSIRVLDIDEHPDAAKTHSVTRLPTVIRFHANGKLSRKVGYTTPQDFFRWLQAHE